MNARFTAILFFALLMDFAIALNNLATSNLVTSLGGGMGHVGMLSGLPFLTYVLVCVFLAPLGDRIKAWKLMAWSALGYGVLLLPVLWVAYVADGPDMRLLIPLYIFLPLSMGCLGVFWPPMQRYISENKSIGELNITLLLFNIFWSVGIALGLLCYGTLNQFGTPFPFWVVIAAAVVIAPGVCLFNRKPMTSIHKLPASSVKRTVTRPADWLSHLQAARIVNFTVHLIGTSAVFLFPVLARSGDYTEHDQSMITMLRGGMEAVAFLVIGALYRYYYRPALPVASLVLTAGGSVLIAVGDNKLIFMAGFGLMGLGLGFAYALALIYSMDGHDDLSTKGGLHEAALGSGIVVGPLICGLAGYLGGMRAPYWTGAVVGVIALASLFVMPWTRGIFHRESESRQ